MRMPPLPADSIHARACKLKCEKILTRPSQNLGAGGNHFRRVCEVLTVSIKITTPKGVVIFMCFVAEKDMRIFTCPVASWLVPQHQSHSVKYLDSTHPKI